MFISIYLLRPYRIGLQEELTDRFRPHDNDNNLNDTKEGYPVFSLHTYSLQ